MRRRTVLAVLLSCLAASVAFVPPAPVKPPRPRYTITDLGTLGGSESGAHAINNSGQIVGWSDKGGASGDLLHTDAFLWQEGKMRALSLASDERFFPAAFAINDRGQILIHAEPHARGLAELSIQVPSYTLLWEKGEVKEFHLFTPSGLNNKGQVVGSATPKGASWPQPAIWEAGQVRFLAMPVGTQNALGHGINDLGEVAGVWSRKDVQGRAFVFRGDRRISLDTPAGFEGAHAHCVNNKGQVVVWAWPDNGHASAFLWQPAPNDRSGKGDSAGKWVNLGGLGDLEEGDHWAYGLNNLGQVVGSSNGRAFLWSEGRIADLNTLIVPKSSWVLHEARGINDRGQICGNGTFNGERRAFLLTPMSR
jgi:probable HAF family extracellular repeat protein